MPPVIIHPDCTATSARKLADDTGWQRGRSYVRRDSIVVNWGYSEQPIMPHTPPDTVLNPFDSVARVVDKIGALDSMSRTSNINVPPFLRSGRLPDDGSLWVIRPAVHSEGSDFNTSRGGSTLRAGEHATKYIRGNEWRIWFTSYGGAFRAMTAKRVPMTTQGQRASDLCRSSWGYSFADNPFPQQLEMAKRAVAHFGLNYGAIDMIWNDEEGKWFILEMNSAPSLDHDRVFTFIRHGIAEMIGSINTAILRQTAARREESDERDERRPSSSSAPQRNPDPAVSIVVVTPDGMRRLILPPGTRIETVR